MTDETRREATDHALDAIAANAEQDRLIVNPTEDCDSIAEHAQRLIRLTQGEAHAHACEILRLAARLRSSNTVEGECVRAIPPLVESDRVRWGVKSAAAALREPLGLLCNPIVQGSRREEAGRLLADLLDVIPAELLMVGQDIRPTLAHELRVAKSTVLRDAILQRRSEVLS